MDRANPGHATVIDGKPVTLPDLYHPTFLYEALWNLGVAALVWLLDRRFKFGRGRAFAIYVMAYTVGRFWIEMMRTDEATEFFGVRLNVFTSIIVFLGALAYFLLVRGPREYVVPDRRAGDRAGAGRPAATSRRSTCLPVTRTTERAKPPKAYQVVSEERFRAYERTGILPPVAAERRDGTRGRRPADETSAASSASSADETTDPRPRREAGDVRTAVVVGAGMAGLATAGALARAGWQVTVLERGERVAAPPTALVLWPNGRARPGVARTRTAAGPAIAAPLPDGGVRRPDGQWLVPPRSRPGAGPAPAVVHLEDLYDALMAGLGDRVEIRTGVDVTTVRVGPGRRPAVGDGRTEFEADLLVAADGIDSPVRRALAPEAVAVGSGFAAWQAVIPGFRAPRLPDDQAVGGETLGAGYRFVSIPLGERAAGQGGVYWVATAAGAARPESAGHPARAAAPLVRRLARAGRRAAGRDPARGPGAAGGARAAAAAPGVRLPLRPGRRGAARRRRPRHAAPPRARAPAWPSRTRPRCGR